LSGIRRFLDGGTSRLLLAALVLVSITVVFATLPPGARATSWGIANANVDQYANAISQDHDFQVLTSASALGPATYQRFLVPWDVAGTYNTTTGQCTAATSYSDNGGNNSLQGLSDALSAAEEAGFTPIISLLSDVPAYDPDYGYDVGWDVDYGVNGYVWPSGANLPSNPNDWDMFCGTEELAWALAAQYLLPGNVYFESYNEPQNPVYGLTGSDCFFYNDPPADNNPADCAARYFADVVSGLASAGYGNYATNVIAGTFQKVDSPSYSPGTACDDQSSFDAQYVCFIEHGDSNSGIPPDGNPLSTYVGYVHNWSFHDYDDVSASYWCYEGAPTGAGECTGTDVENMLDLMSYSDAPGGSNVWLTETGCRDDQTNPSTGCGNLADHDQVGNEAYDWTLLKDTAFPYPLTAILWYEYYSDSWDTGLLDGSGEARESYCVLGDGGVMGTGDPGQDEWHGVDCNGN